MIEQLTVKMRVMLSESMVGTEALRIIDAHAAERAALVERAERAELGQRVCNQELDALRRDQERQSDEYQADIERRAETHRALAADRAALVARVEELERLHEQALNERDAAHLEIASSEATWTETRGREP